MKRIICFLLAMAVFSLPLTGIEAAEETLVIDECDFERQINWRLYNFEGCRAGLEELREDFGYSYVINAGTGTAPYYQYYDNSSAFTAGEIKLEVDFMIDSDVGRYDFFVVYQSDRKTNNDCYVQDAKLAGTGITVSLNEWHHLEYTLNIAEGYSRIGYDGEQVKENRNILSDGTFGGISFIVRNLEKFHGGTNTMQLCLDNIEITKQTSRAAVSSVRYYTAEKAEIGGDTSKNELFYVEVEFDRPLCFGTVKKDCVSVTAGKREYGDFYVLCDKDNPRRVWIYFDKALKKGERYSIDLSRLKDEWRCEVMRESVIKFDTETSSYSGIGWSVWSREGELCDAAEISDGDEVRLRADFANVYEDVWKPCILAFAVYADGQLTDVITEEITVPPYVPDLYLTTDYLKIKNTENKKLTFKGFLWERGTLSTELEDFLLESKAMTHTASLNPDFSQLDRYTEDEITNPSEYFSGYETAKKYFDGTVCFAADSSYIFGLDKKYVIDEKPIYYDGQIWTEKGVVEKLFGAYEWQHSKDIDGKTYLPLRETAEQLGLYESESYKGLAIISDKAYDISGSSTLEYVKEMLRYIVFEKPSAQTLQSLARTVEHPRTVARQNELLKLENEQDYTMRQMSKAIIKDAAALLKADVVKKPNEGGSSDGADFHAILKLYWAYRMTGDRAYADKAIAHAVAMSQWEHWKDSYYFLQTAYCMLTCGYTYDLFYDELSADERKTIAEAIVEKGLRPASRHLYGRGESNWPLRLTNWNVVCNSGTIVAALALCNDYESDLCFDTLEKSLTSLEYAMLEYAPNGGWYEGVGYSGYAVNYQTLALQALTTVFGTDFGTANTPGFLKNGYFPFYMTVADGKFNLHDDIRGSNLISTASMWTAHYTGDYTLQRLRLEQIKYLNKNKPTFLDLLWYMPEEEGRVSAPLDIKYGYAEMATSRSGWDGDSTWLGVHAGDNSVSHGQIDIGQFELESEGVRFALDMGRDSYSLPNYFHFGSTREEYYVCRAEGHNLYVINPDKAPGQYYYAASEIETVAEKPDGVIYTIDMTPAYIGEVKHAKRGFALKNNRRIFVMQDEIKPKRLTDEYYWFWHTEAQIDICGDNRVRLTRDGKRLDLYFDANVDFTISKGLSEPLETSPKGEGEQLVEYKKVNKLTARFTSNKEEVKFRVTAVPEGTVYEREKLGDISMWTVGEGIGSGRYDISGKLISNVLYGTGIDEFLGNINCGEEEKNVIKDGTAVCKGTLSEGMYLKCGGERYDIEFVPADIKLDSISKTVTGILANTPMGLILNQLSAELAGEMPADGFVYDGMRLNIGSEQYTVKLAAPYLDAGFDGYTGAVYASKTTAQRAPDGFDTIYFGTALGEGAAVKGEKGALHITAGGDEECIIQMFKNIPEVKGCRVRLEFDFMADNLNSELAIEGRFNQAPHSMLRFGTDGAVYVFGTPVAFYEPGTQYRVELTFNPGSSLYTLRLNGENAAAYHTKLLNDATMTQLKVKVAAAAGEQTSIWLDNAHMMCVYR